MWRWDQAEPFGSNPANEDPDANSVAFDLPLRLPGQRYDKETALHYNYFRDYDPSIGRYGESDPIGLWGGINTYAYAKSSPLAYVDLRGLRVQRCCRSAQILRGKVDHCWFTTDTRAAGMNSTPECRIAGDDYEPPYTTPVVVSDHSCDKPDFCEDVENIDEDCVNEELGIGKSLGRFGPTNNCRTFMIQVIDRCTTGWPVPTVP